LSQEKPLTQAKRKNSHDETDIRNYPVLVLDNLLIRDSGEAKPESPAVMVEKAAHFTTPDGTDHIVVKAGVGIRLYPLLT
jgi:hypothetical protein